MGTNDRLLQCEITEGMLPGEVAVAIKTATGPVSLFAPREAVSTSSKGERLQVVLLDEDSKYGLIRLPAMPVDGSQVIKVERSSLEVWGQ